MFMACHGDGLLGSYDRPLSTRRDGYIIGQFHWLSRLSSLLVTMRMMVHWQPLFAPVVAECGINFVLGSCAVVHASSCA